MANNSCLKTTGIAAAALCLLLPLCCAAVFSATQQARPKQTTPGGSNQKDPYDAVGKPEGRKEKRAGSLPSDEQSCCVHSRDDNNSGERRSSSQERIRRSSRWLSHWRSSSTSLLTKPSGTTPKFFIAAGLVAAAIYVFVQAGDAFWKCLADVAASTESHTGPAPRALSGSGGDSGQCLSFLVGEPDTGGGSERTPRPVISAKLLRGFLGAMATVLALALLGAHPWGGPREEGRQLSFLDLAEREPHGVVSVEKRKRKDGTEVVDIGRLWNGWESNRTRRRSFTVSFGSTRFHLHVSDQTAKDLGKPMLDRLMRQLRKNAPVAQGKEVRWGKEGRRWSDYMSWTLNGTHYSVRLPADILEFLDSPDGLGARGDLHALLFTAVKCMAGKA